MLVLSRRKNESIVIGESIKLTVIRTGKGIVKLGLEAPQEIPIRRVELASNCEPRSTSGVQQSRRVRRSRHAASRTGRQAHGQFRD